MFWKIDLKGNKGGILLLKKDLEDSETSFEVIEDNDTYYLKIENGLESDNCETLVKYTSDNINPYFGYLKALGYGQIQIGSASRIHPNGDIDGFGTFKTQTIVQVEVHG